MESECHCSILIKTALAEVDKQRRAEVHQCTSYGQGGGWILIAVASVACHFQLSLTAEAAEKPHSLFAPLTERRTQRGQLFAFSFPVSYACSAQHIHIA